MHKSKLLSPKDFELAWRLRPDSWFLGELRGCRHKELARRVLVDGEHMHDVWDTDDFDDNSALCDGGSVAKHRLIKIVREVREQLFIEVG